MKGVAAAEEPTKTVDLMPYSVKISPTKAPLSLEPPLGPGFPVRSKHVHHRVSLGWEWNEVGEGPKNHALY